ncbi:MAG: PaaI family thioesterase [Sphaerotilus sulfidivorans]|uniref:PaaI family thioesterase n=1 Tax=Sphaerotilus sulfidivorans TaxID=639200 RepID=UPI003F3E38E6
MQFPVPIPFVDHLGFELVRFADGQAEIHLELRPELLNSFMVAHGGVSMTLLDVVMAHAARSSVPDSGAVTIEMKTSFFRPGEGRLRAVGRLLHRSATMAFTEGHVYGGHGELCAHATGTFKYVKRLPAGHGGRAIKALNRPGEDEAPAQDPHPRTDQPR